MYRNIYIYVYWKRERERESKKIDMKEKRKEKDDEYSGCIAAAASYNIGSISVIAPPGAFWQMAFVSEAAMAVVVLF